MQIGHEADPESGEFLREPGHAQVRPRDVDVMPLVQESVRRGARRGPDRDGRESLQHVPPSEAMGRQRGTHTS